MNDPHDQDPNETSDKKQNTKLPQKKEEIQTII
jgi:hypothetical protein